MVMNNDNLEKLRGIYFNDETLGADNLPADPIELFNQWLAEAVSTDMLEPNGFVLSTVSNGRPRSRVVLLKGVDEEKFVFYTNYHSAKGREIEHGEFVAMNFWWTALGRQVRIEGVIEKVEEHVSDAYFHKRPRGSQLGAIASPQSQIVSSRKELEELFNKTSQTFESIEIIPRPKHWGGYAIKPDYMEFWQGRANRLHDRVSYQLVDEGWKTSRLAP